MSSSLLKGLALRIVSLVAPLGYVNIPKNQNLLPGGASFLFFGEKMIGLIILLFVLNLFYFWQIIVNRKAIKLLKATLDFTVFTYGDLIKDLADGSSSLANLVSESEKRNAKILLDVIGQNLNIINALQEQGIKVKKKSTLSLKKQDLSSKEKFFDIYPPILLDDINPHKKDQDE